MVDFINIPFDLGSAAQLASSNPYGFWVTIAINLVISSIVGGIVLVAVLWLFNRFYGEMLVYKRAFAVVLLANIIFFVGVMGLLTPIISAIPYLGTFSSIVIPIVIWILLLKLFFEDMSFLHTIIVGAVFFALTSMAVPYIVSLTSNFLGL